MSKRRVVVQYTRKGKLVRYARTVNIRYVKKFNMTHEKTRFGFIRASIRDIIIHTFESRALPVYGKRNGKSIAEKGIMGYDNQHFKKELDAALADAKVSYEDDEAQINLDYTKKHPPIKLIYNMRTRSLQAFIRDYRIR